jgi:hypothetical protein
MKNKLFFAIFGAAALSVAGLAAEPSDSQDVQLNKLLTEMNGAPSDQKLSAIVTLLNKLVEERKALPEQTPAPKKEMSMCMCCAMMKSDQSGQQGGQSEHAHH